MSRATSPSSNRIPLAIYALMIGAFGIGTTEFVIMGILPQLAADLGVSLASAGLLISGYAIGVAVGAPFLSIYSARFPQKYALIGLMALFTLGNLVCALAPDYWVLMTARVLTSLAHGTFFGIGSVLATSLVKPNQRASAIALMFTGLTLANILGVPFGTWLGQLQGWRMTFWAVTLVGPLAMLALLAFVPQTKTEQEKPNVKREVRTLLQPDVLLSLFLTIVGFGGVFTLFTFIAPLLTQISNFEEKLISPILLLFGLGLILGNLLGGKLADKKLMPTLIGSLTLLTLVMLGFYFFSQSQTAIVILVFLLGFAGFATVPPLQMRALEAAKAAPVLSSAANIAAFNIGNALGAWVGGLIIDRGPGLVAIPFGGALIAGLALVTALVAGRSKQVLESKTT